jgi:single stranded DNA-binding protein
MFKLTVIGRLGKDPEMKTTATGKKLCSISVASNKKRKTSKGEVTDWVYLTAWEKRAELICQYLSKGSVIYAECEMSNNEDNTKKDNYTILDITFLSAPKVKPLDAAVQTALASQNPFRESSTLQTPSSVSNDGYFGDELPF